MDVVVSLVVIEEFSLSLFGRSLPNEQIGEQWNIEVLRKRLGIDRLCSPGLGVIGDDGKALLLEVFGDEFCIFARRAVDETISRELRYLSSGCVLLSAWLNWRMWR
jgi:hypothetical protein